MGLLSLDAKQFDHALEWITRAVSQDAKPEYLSSLGATLHQQGRLEEALTAFDRAIQLAPDDAEPWKNRGNVLVELKRPADAVVSFEQTLKLNPRHWDAAYRCGFLLYELGRHAEAIVYFDLVDRLQPNQAVILEMRAAVLHRLKRFDEALADNQRAHALNPGNADHLQQHRRRAASARPGRRTRCHGSSGPSTLRPDYIEALTNKAASLQQLHRFEDAAATYRHVKTIAPDDAETDWNLSLLQLLTGNFEDGWAGREARWKCAPRGNLPDIPRAEMARRRRHRRQDHPDLHGRRTGGRDPVRALRAGGGGARRACDPAGAARRLSVVGKTPRRRAMPAVLGSRARCRRSTCTARCPACRSPSRRGSRPFRPPLSYLPPPPQARVQAWQDRLGPHDKLRIGLVWAGNPDHKNDHNRSTSLRMLSRLLDLDATFVSLQKDPRPEDQATLREHPDIIDLDRRSH